MTGSEIREKFLKFFEGKGHQRVHSSSLVPQNDPTLLFTNAGMNQFKDVFLGLENRGYSRATTSQKCVRAGGKHNDLENVGFTNRHHTFFEMLGNFSFGDYFKKDAVAYAWDLITSPEWFGIEKAKLYVTIFKGSDYPDDEFLRDDEAEKLWISVGVLQERIFAMGMKDNFWQMGDTGPCGPCSEIHYDMGVAAGDQGHTDCKFPCDCGRYVEIWNLVFMQYNRDRDGNSYSTKLLPKPSIDTGMGLERVASVLQGVISNYETDLFTPLTKRAAELTGLSLQQETQKEGKATSAASLRVIADHARAATFLISDGVIPGNEGRNYVLRKIIRRAITHGRLLGMMRPFLSQMVFAVRDLMQDAYPELKETAERVSKTVLAEEIRFSNTLDLGLKKLEEDLRPLIEEKQSGRLVGRARTADSKYDGEKAFKLYDTFGMPLDFMHDAARDQGIGFDQAGFDRAMEEQKTRARASWKGAAKQSASPLYTTVDNKLSIRPFPATPGAISGFPIRQPYSHSYFPYDSTGDLHTEVVAIIANGVEVHELKPGEHGEILLYETPFYAESGGQVGDHGWLYSDDGNVLLADVEGCYYPIPKMRAHKVVAKQAIRVGDKVDAVVDSELRRSTMRHHTATHLLQAGLREVLGKHVKQMGSLVHPGHLRFDFSHFAGVEDSELQDIEDIINKEVLRNEKVDVLVDVPIDQAVNEYKAMALFGEKYGDKVRVVKIGDFSTELCGGTHTRATGEIGLIKILSEGSVSSGVRRIEAVAGEKSLEHFRQDHELGRVVAGFAGAGSGVSNPSKDPALSQGARQGRGTRPAEALRAELERKDAEIKRLTRELDQVRMKSASSSVGSVEDKIKVVKGVKVLAHRVDNLERAQLRTLVDQLRDKIGSGVVVLGSAGEAGVSLIVAVTKDLTGRVQAGKVIAPIALKVGGKGGGRPDMAEAGGKDAAVLDAALSEVYAVVEGLLSV
jgi:alanyl-tRNA synthetase